jgi:hypothetical protein
VIFNRLKCMHNNVDSSDIHGSAEEGPFEGGERREGVVVVRCSA